MRVYIIASLIAIAYSARVNVAPKFSMVEERSSNGAPSVSVTFPDGYQDNLVLSRFDANDEDRMANKEHCNFIGHLENEPEACVAMTGCSGSEDVHLTIISNHVMQRSSMFTWKKDGSVEVIDKTNGLHGPRMEPLVKPRPYWGTFGAPTVVQGDEGLPPAGEVVALNNAEANCANSGSCSLPATQHIQLRVGYDDGMWNQFDQDASLIDAYITSIWAHLQTNYCHSTLGSKVLVEKLAGNKHYAGISLAGDGASLAKMFDHTVNDLGSADLMLYFGHIGEGYASGGGIAYLAVVCDQGNDKIKESINNYGSSHSSMGELLAHEVGHNLGMSHDFDEKHGGDGTTGSGGPCDFEGFMSYGNSKSQWSDCSVKDFTAQYEANKNFWCLPAAPTACGGTAAPTTAAPTTAAPTTAAPTTAAPTTAAPTTCQGNLGNFGQSWIGDNYCDDENNNAACQFDGGDCCNNSGQFWDRYCSACQCLQPSCQSLGGVNNWIGDSYCDDQNNNAACQFDGGDCCNNSNQFWDWYCLDCACLSR